MTWDDLKLLLAVADKGGIAAAARSLELDPASLGERIGALEKALGAGLVAPSADGLPLSAAGERAVATARRMLAEVSQLADDLVVSTSELSGTLRIATTDSFGTHVMQALSPLRDRHPGLSVDLLTANTTVDLRRREADLAVRMYLNHDENLDSLKLGSLGWSLYASAKYLASRSGGPGLLDGHRVIGYSDSLRGMAGAQWIAANAQPDDIRMQCSGPGAALKVALTGFGVCVIPCYMAVDEPLERLTKDVLTHTDVYAVFLPERRNEPVVRAAIDALLDMFARERSMLHG